MEQVDIQSGDVSTDISATETQADTPEALHETPDTTQSQVQPGKEEQAKPYSPFAAGKEKFKVNGQEREWDWETTKKYAQLGYAGQAALEKAHETEKKARKLYSDIMQHAQTDPEGLIRILNPKFQGFSSARAPSAQPGQSQDQEQDPRDAKIQELEQRYQSVEQILEQQEIQKERQAIQSELDAACKSYPELDNEINREYVKAQYKKILQKGIDGITIEDVAFHAAQKIKEQQAVKVKEQVTRLQENKKKAPVGSAPAGSAGSAKPMTREDVMRLAGKIN